MIVNWTEETRYIMGCQGVVQNYLYQNQKLLGGPLQRRVERDETPCGQQTKNNIHKKQPEEGRISLGGGEMTCSKRHGENDRVKYSWGKKADKRRSDETFQDKPTVVGERRFNVK